MKFYVTTPIYYVNDQPHIGHAYTTLAADVLARYHRMRGEPVMFLTGTDEHGQKVAEAAAAKGRTPKEHADLMVRNFRDLWETFGISNDAFIRTTDPQHIEVVQELMQVLFDRGEIERRTYRGWYCTPDERFWTEKDLEDGNCPECGRPVEQIDEDNYFFLMSRYAERLQGHIEENPEYVLPETRRNEVLGFLKSQPLHDLCISRPKHRLDWGVELPFDRDYVTYVWFDALINYYSSTRYLADRITREGKEVSFWPADVQLIGKDILTTHAVYWSTMLMAMDLPLPKTIFAHGWWTIEGKKMSKSLGNVVDPEEMAERYGTDAFRFFLFREVPFGLDGDFSEDALVGRINTDLANDLGNLASRTLKMAENYFGSEVPSPGPELTDDEHGLKAVAEGLPYRVEGALKVVKFQKAIEEIWRVVSGANKYLDTNAPWKLAKDPGSSERLSTVMYNTLEALRVIALHLHPFMPGATGKLWQALGMEGPLDTSDIYEHSSWGRLAPGTKLGKLEALFPRIDTGKEKKKEKPKMQDKDNKKEERKDDGLITIKDFAKVEIRTGKVIEAERVEGSEKLLKLQVDTGENRQIVAGIAKAYAPEDLVGKIVVVVTNLKPAKLMGVESQGMLLAATGDDGVPVVLMPEKETPPGLRIK